MSEPTGDQQKPSRFHDVELIMPPSDPKVDNRVNQLISHLAAKNIKADPITTKYFYDPDLFYALTAEKQDDELIPYIVNMGKFADARYPARERRWNGDESGLLGEEIHIPETQHFNGRVRRAEEGYKLNIDYLSTIGIDPTKVLFFRVTQPMGEQPKPEYYWTSDFFETVDGLTQEIPFSQRNTSVILVADLKTINDNGGLIQDINDDSGMAVRQIGTGPFDQTRAIAKFQVSPPTE